MLFVYSTAKVTTMVIGHSVKGGAYAGLESA
jgi:hypothetical protein